MATLPVQEQPLFGANPTGNIITPPKFLYSKLSNGGSFDMGVDGSVSNQSFSYTVPPDKSITIHTVTLFILSGSNFNYDEFGDESELTNGIQFNIGGVEVFNIKNNLDIASNFLNVQSSFLGSNLRRFIMGVFDFKTPVMVQSDEVIEMIVRDNLTGIEYIEASIKGTTNN